MRLKHSWVIALFLVGCQSTPTEDTAKTSVPTNKNTSSSKQDSKNKRLFERSPATARKAFQAQPEALTAQEQADLWDRIVLQFRLPIPENERVDYYRRWYLDHPEHLDIVAKRADPFLYLITEKIEQRGLPLELALLPVVESSFDAFAYSKGSAAGLWQFIPSTGRLYGLKQNYWYDGRRDVNAATDAALKYLSNLGKRFKGNWPQAIAAYNSGEGRVYRAIKTNKANGKPTDFFSLSLPAETTDYVPKLLALADVLAQREKYGLTLPAIDNEPQLELVRPGEQLDLAIAAKYAEISVKELESYNPGYNRWATAPSGPHSLLLPIDSVDTFNDNLASHKGEGLHLVRYQVKSGDTLSEIASRYRTTTQVIKNANQLDSNTIRIGQYLLVPKSIQDASTYALSAQNRLKATQSKSQGQYKLSHVVQRGESLWTIAKHHNVSYQSLAKWNGLGPKDTLRTGQSLVVWKKGQPGSVIRRVSYQVKSGDTLSEIAVKFKVNRSDIVQWNNLHQQKYLQPGQDLKLYVDVTKVSV
ncbi:MULTISPECIES: LysM peptidoglycan-binding domain-containing protein [unclassified Vibrio]|uniref:LysM peptidoglycan-binding domain-containing protein n=1 Tax=Vibrio sp. HB236076 TaxID=3232307 RepID=A0AB39HD08_9VIBR|nr:LysM peptidoglycan-binding domain-containing protein [Vibrio sp. HB161653]MDP5254837.1 LysM peptidoglycan-binding domain-containing protein [Vibrio sp. HB161653]